eukprot:s766_g8.t1
MPQPVLYARARTASIQPIMYAGAITSSTPAARLQAAAADDDPAGPPCLPSCPEIGGLPPTLDWTADDPFPALQPPGSAAPDILLNLAIRQRVSGAAFRQRGPSSPICLGWGRDVLRACRRLWPAHHFCLWLHGPHGSGKSRLAWGNEMRPGLADLLAHGAFRALEGLGFSEPLPEDSVLMTVQPPALPGLGDSSISALGLSAASLFAMSANTADLDVTNPEQALDLNNIRSVLQRMEDSIIFSLIERSQYRVNKAVYQADHPQLGAFRQHQLKAAGSNGCLGDWFIYQTECLHSQVRRYLHPTEFSFFGPLPEPSLGGQSRSKAEPVLAPVPAEAKVNQRLLELYRTKMIPSLCEEGDDGNHGSTAVQDVHVLQTMSTRIYFGLFVAESKFRSEKAKATALIEAKDAEGLTAFITKPEVEARNVQRVIVKAKTFSQNIAGAQGSSDAEPATYKVNAEYIGKLFQEYIMPLTKDVEVAYLLSRLDGLKRKDPEMEIHPEWSTSPSSLKKRRISESG